MPAMDLWKTIADFAGFPDDYGEDEYTKARSPFGTWDKVIVSVTYSEDECNPVTVFINTQEVDIHNEIVTKLVEYLQSINSNTVILAHNGHTNEWVVNAAPY